MPPQIIPPMYKMLLEEIDIAVQDKDPYTFTHYLILSKTYVEVISKLDGEDSRPQKKKKQQSNVQEIFYFHAEDEIFSKFSLGTGAFEYTKVGDPGASDARRAFQEAGIKPQGQLTLIEGSRFQEAVEAVEAYVSG